MWSYEHDDYFHHSGIKGMKWGVRRYQNKDGTLTPAGKKRYADDDGNNGQKIQNGKKQSRSESHREALIQKYKDAGFDQKDAELHANDRIRTEKIVATMAAVTVAACAGYALNKYVKDRTDGIIKSGEILQRIEMADTGGKLHDEFFVSKGKHDNARYKGLLGMTRQQQTGHAYLMSLKANSDVKVASKDKAAKAFGELFKNDPEFRNAVKDYSEQHFSGRNKRDVTKLSDKNIRKMYENFNSNLLHIRDSGTGADKKFFEALKKSGYGAIQDINDMKYSGYNARNPIIVFDNTNKNIAVQSVRELNKSDNIVGNGLKELGKAQVEQIGKKLIAPKTAAALTSVAGAMVVSDYSDVKRYNSSKRYSANSSVIAYKKEHPNTKLSDKEIYEMQR